MATRRVPDFVLQWLQQPDAEQLPALEQALHQASPALIAAAQDLVQSLQYREHLLHQRRRLEWEQRALKQILSEPGDSETNTPPAGFWSVEGPSPLTDQELLTAAALFGVKGEDEVHAIMDLRAQRASNHYANCELAYDNRVIRFHNASLRARAQARHRRLRERTQPAPAVDRSLSP